jgi:hypothetical protein
MDYTLKIEATLLHTYQNTRCQNTAANNVNRQGSFENTEMKTTVGPKRTGIFFEKSEWKRPIGRQRGFSFYYVLGWWGEAKSTWHIGH